ncbi:MAG: CotH kinase family protein [Mobilitalea sp.]
MAGEMFIPLKLQMTGPARNEPIHVKQYNTKSMYFNVELFSTETVPYIIPFNYTDVRIQGTKKDKTIFGYECTNVMSNTLVAHLPEEALEVPGTITAEIYIKWADGDIRSQSFTLYVDQAAVNMEDVQSSDSFNALESRLIEIDKFLSDVDNSDIMAKIQGLPKVFFDVDDFNIWGGKEDERKGFFEYVDESKKLSAFVKIKPQGTSSLSYPKKNFNITFYTNNTYSSKKKLDIKWGEQSKYTLKANYIDPTQSSNVVTANLAALMQKKYELFKDSPNAGMVDGFPVAVHVNGEFYGLYTLNIPKDGWMFGMTSDNANHIIMCAEEQYAAGAFRELADNITWSVEFGADNSATYTKFNRMISFVKDSSDNDFKTNIGQYLNLSCCLNYYAFAHLFGLIDNLGKNMLMVTYDGLVWSPSLYDLDSGMGTSFDGITPISPYVVCPDQYECNTSLLWEKIVRNFGNELALRYFELRQDILTRGNIIKYYSSFIYRIPQRLYNDDKDLWPGTSVMVRTIESIMAFFKNRIPYVDLQMKNLLASPDTYYGDVIYNLASLYLADGIDDYIDTNVKLYRNQDREWTLIFRAMTDIPAGYTAYLSCFSEGSPYRGLLVTKVPGKHELRITVGDNYTVEFPYDEGRSENFLVIRKVGDVYDIFVNGEKKPEIVAHADQYLGNLLIACQDDSEFNKFRFSKVTMKNVTFYNKALSDGQVNEIMNQMMHTDFGTLQYNLPMFFVGNGIDSYVDTGIKLYQNPKGEFTVDIDFYLAITGGDGIYCSCFSELYPNYHGLLIRKSTVYDNGVNVVIGNNYSVDYDLTGISRAHIVIRKVGTIYSTFVNGEKKTDINDEEIQYLGNLLLGCQDTGDFTKFRFSGVTINSCKIYEKGLSDEQILAN